MEHMVLECLFSKELSARINDSVMYKFDDICKSQYKNVGKMEYKNVGFSVTNH